MSNGIDRFSRAAEVALSATEIAQYGGQYELQVLALYLNTRSEIRHRNIRSSALIVLVLACSIAAVVLVLHSVNL